MFSLFLFPVCTLHFLTDKTDLADLSHLARLTKWFIYQHIHDVNVLFDIVEDVLQQTWGIEEITEKFQKPDEGESFWKVSFTQRDDIPEDIFKRNGYIEITEDDEYISRYDLTYLTPCFHKLRCKVSYRDLLSLFFLGRQRTCVMRNRTPKFFCYIFTLNSINLLCPLTACP